MRLGKLGEQFILKSPAAFEKIQFVSYEVADNTEYYSKRKVRDDEARAAFRAKDINKAAGSTLLALARALGCRMEHLLEG